jgi:cell division transport system permease protein
MNLLTALSRAKRACRDDMHLHAVAVASLAVAFLCLGVTQLAVSNLGRIAEKWGQSRHLTVYLEDGAERSAVEQLTLVLESLPEVKSIEHVSAESARQQFVEQVEMGADGSSLPAEFFPASLEIELRQKVTDKRLTEIAERVGLLAPVEEVETYRSWFADLERVLTGAELAAWALAVMVAVCVVAVIGNSIRLAVANRRDEIEVLKLCGATDGFVRAPFVAEGTIQGLVSAMVAMLILLVVYASLVGQVRPTFSVLTGVNPCFVDPLLVLAIIVGGGVVGALGSALSLRRYLVV